MDQNSNYWNTSSRNDGLWYCCYWTNIFVFGGRCNGGMCNHNELYALNTDSKVWRKIHCTEGPMEKYSFGFISYFYQGTDYLLVLGGKARKEPTQQQKHSLYIPCGYGNYYTNEIHTMEIYNLQGNVYISHLYLLWCHILYYHHHLLCYTYFR